MTVETAPYISTLNSSYPADGDDIAEGDNAIRLIKSALVASFPNVAGAVTATHTELTYVDGVTSAIQTQLDAKAPIASPTFTGTPAAPTAAVGTNSTQLATMAAVQAAIAAVNATSSVTFSVSASTAPTVSEGEVIAATAATAVAAVFPPSPTTGALCGIINDNGLTTNTVDLGANSIKHNGSTITGVIMNDARIPMLLRWGGDYWRFI